MADNTEKHITLCKELGIEPNNHALASSELLMVCIAQQELITELQDQLCLINPGYVPSNRAGT